MSGPKVVRIVTREEVLAICEAHLHRLDHAIAAWTASGQRIRELSAEEIAATHERRKALAALIAKDAFMELQKKVPDEIAFLKADVGRRQRAAVEKAEQSAKRRRQGRDSATTLRGALKSKGIVVPQDLGSKLDLIASGEDVANADILLAQGFNLLVPEPSRTISEAQQKLASRLMGTETPQDLGDWKAANVSPSNNLLYERVDRQIAEAQVFLEEADVAKFAARLRAIETESNEQRRNLLLDSLILDVSSAIDATRAHRSAIEELQQLAAEISANTSVEAMALFTRIEHCGSATSLQAIAQLAEECKNVVEQEQQRQAAQARRDAILKGFARLGYEVNDGMETAWARDGRVVVKNPALPGYGVEIGGQAKSSRLQVRAVALSANRDVVRDKDVEMLWCGDFGRLQEFLVAEGDSLLIERAMGVGEIPLKVIGDAETETVSVEKRRSLR
ncbi:hypothetical protein AWB75_06814 [Caballeronia catudaia]|uniref:Uncharacterized protein n=1 Tax=Caballeronia catudaia TaxID=1777136 RepID=A0A158DIU5_9BURK|nr:hypothetical protein [Caballeronia catudaia]SAK94504.1 hypothetical protein AWB75_06814 [Caballeronia catudaia]